MLTVDRFFLGKKCKELNMDETDRSLMFVCPVCQASLHQECYVQAGVRRDESHWERWELANDAFINNAIRSMPNASNVRLVPKK
jgi:hypothetical protein